MSADVGGAEVGSAGAEVGGTGADVGATARPAPVGSTRPPGVSFRPAGRDDLPACAAIWRDSINDYLAPRNVALIPDELGPISRLYGHLQATDPERFVVATRRSADGGHAERVLGFASAVVREQVWYLSMLFVRPAEQGRGLGRGLLDAVLPARPSGQALATATDSLQPISNGLYASYGIVPRLPLLSLVGRPSRTGALAELPSGVAPASLRPDDMPDVARLDAAVLGYRHAEDHAFVAGEGRQGYSYRDGRGELVGYGYTSAIGRIGPVAVRETGLLWPVVSHLLRVVEPRGASAVWAAGDSTDVVVGLLRAGFRLEDYPILLCWSRPFADFGRYLPISPGLL